VADSLLDLVRRSSGAAATDAPSDREIEAALAVLQRLPAREVQKRGWNFQRADYYSPLNDLAFLEANPDLWSGEEPTPEIDWNHAAQVATARRVADYVEELRDIPNDPVPGDPTRFCWNNNFWNAADALVQYGLARAGRPKRWVEIGCGWSSLLLARALEKNDTPTEVTQIEPYPNPALFAAVPPSWKQHRTILQRAPLELFDALEPGDVCFYDGSHCVRAASDVNWFFFRVLPRLRNGVLVHLHDIFLPESYPTEWVFERGQTWNEQWLLQAYLMSNPAVEILIANRWLFRREYALLRDLYQDVQPPWGCSFWFRKVDPR
jgi:predicted O-methyltransferase YrrM